MSRFTSEEMRVRIDAALSGYEGQEAGVGPDPGGASVDWGVVEAIGEIDSPISAVGDEWRTVALEAWLALTEDDELPEWFDDWATIGEMARRSGRSRSEVRAALDVAKGSLVDAHGSTDFLPGGPLGVWLGEVSPPSVDPPVRADHLLIEGLVLTVRGEHLDPGTAGRRRM